MVTKAPTLCSAKLEAGCVQVCRACSVRGSFHDRVGQHEDVTREWAMELAITEVWDFMITIKVG